MISYNKTHTKKTENIFKDCVCTKKSIIIIYTKKDITLNIYSDAIWTDHTL